MRATGCLCLLLLACGDDPRRSPDSGPPGDAGGFDAAPTRDADTDAGEDTDAGGAPGCASPSRVDEAFEVAPALGDTQIHPEALFDGEAIWVAFSVPEEGDTGLFDIFAVRLGCDGSAVTPPFRVNTTVAPNDIDPVMAMAGDRVLVAWTSDDGTGVNNLDVRYRLFDADGSPRGDDRILETTRGGAPVPGNVAQPSVVGLSTGGFAVAAVRGLDAAMRFQVFVQRLDADGALDGEAVDGFFEPMVSQGNPSLAEAPDGTLHLAWVGGDDADTEQVVLKVVDDGSAVPGKAIDGFVATRGPSLAFCGEDLHLAASAGGAGQSDVVVDDRARAARETLGARGELDHSPNLVVDGDAVAVAWLRVIGGIRNGVHVAPLVRGESGLAAGAARELPLVEPSAPYGVALTHVAGDVWFVAWVEGISPAFRVRGVLASLP